MLNISTQCFPPTIGGIESLVYFLARKFSQTGIDVRVYADSMSADTSVFDGRQVFHIQRFGGLKPLRRRAKAREIYLQSTAPKDNQLVLLADTWKSLEHINTALINRTACLAHGSELPEQPGLIKHKRIKKALSKADVVIANSAFTAERLMPFVDSTKVKTVAPGINTPEDDPASVQRVNSELENKGPVLITVARLEERKGHARVLSLLPALIKDYPSLVYLIVGDGPCRNTLEAEVRHNNLQHHVRFIGTLTGADKNAYLCNSDIFIMPGKKVGDDVEGFGIAYIEAAYFGVPSIANNIGGVADAVKHDVTGLLCEADDPSEPEKSLRKLITDNNKRQQLGEKARENAASYLWDEKIKDYYNLLFGT